MGSIPESERSHRGGQGNPLQYSCLENLLARGAWWTTVHGVAKSQTQLSNLVCLHTYISIYVHVYIMNLYKVVKNTNIPIYEQRTRTFNNQMYKP